MSIMRADNATTKPTATAKKWKPWIIGWLPVGIGLVSWFIPNNDSSPRILGLFAAVALSVTLHEIAHFLVAEMVGLKPWCLRIGHGEVVFDRQYHAFRLILKSLPYSGAIYPFPFVDPSRRSRWRRFFMVLAGPLANALLLAIFLLIVLRSEDSSDLSAIPMQMLVANIYLVVWSLVPHRTNDGMILWNLITNRPLKSSRRRFEYNPSWQWTVKQIPPDVLLTQYRTLLSHPRLTPEQRLETLDGFATCVLMYGVPECLAEADQYSEELVRSKPEEWTFKGTRGGILVEKGEIVAGAAMLKDVVIHDANPFDRSIAASFLALAEIKQGNLNEAAKWLEISEQNDPDCASLIRIKRLLVTRSSTC